MVQSDIPKGQTSSGKINARWYLQRLKASAANRTSSSSSKQTIRIVKGSTHNQQRIPTISLQSASHKKKVFFFLILLYFIERINSSVEIQGKQSFEFVGYKICEFIEIFVNFESKLFVVVGIQFNKL